MAGRHTISVTILGNNRDLNRALASSSREVNKLAREFKKMHGTVDGAGAAFERFRKSESMRITITEKIDRARVGFRRLGDVVGLSAAGMGAWQAAAAVAGIAATALSGLLVGAAGGGLVGAFALLWFQTDKAKEKMQALGTYIRNDLINKTMKPFYDEVAKLPDVLRKSYDAAKPEFEKLGQALKPMMQDINDALPGLIKNVAKLFTSVAEAARPFFKAILDGMPDVIKGIKGFFDAFKNNGDPSVIKKLFRDIGAAIKALGEFLADLDADDYEKFKNIIIEASRGIVKAIRAVNTIVEKVDGVLRKFGTNIYEVAAAGIVLGGAMRVFGPILKVFNGAWRLFNKLNLATTLRTILGVARPLLGVLIRFAGPIGIIVTAITGWLYVFKEINTEGSKLNQWWKDLTNSDAWNDMVGSFNDFKDAISEGLSEIKKAWDDAWRELEAAGVIDALKTVKDALADVALFIVGGVFKSAFTTLAATFKIAAAGARGFAEVIKFVINGVSATLKNGQIAFTAFKTVTQTVWNAAANIVKTAFEKMREIWNSIKDRVQPVIDAFQKVRDKAREIWESIKDRIKTINDSIRDTLREIWDNVRDRLRNIWDSIRDKIRDINDSIRDKIRDIWDSIRDRIRTINDAIRDKIREIWDNVRDKVRDINDAIRDKVREIWDNVRDKVRDINDSIRDKVRQIWDAIRDKMREVNDAIRDKVREIWDGVRDAIRDKAQAALDIVREKMTSILQAVKDKASSMVQAGKDLLIGLANGIRQGGVEAIAAIAGVAIEVVNKAKGLFRIGSPSKLFRQYGLWIGDGLAQGITKSEAPVSKATTSLVDEMKGIGELAALVQVDSSTLSKIYKAEIDAAKSATDELRSIWTTWGNDFNKIVSNSGAPFSASAPVGGTTTITENRNYYLTVNSNSPNAGREIVTEIQKFERVNGSSWRR